MVRADIVFARPLLEEAGPSMAFSRTSAAGKASTSARGVLQEVAEGSDSSSGSGERLFEIRRLSGPEGSRIGGVNGDEMDSDLKSEMFLDLFDAFLGSQATALPQSAGAAEVSGYSFQSGQYVDDRAVQMSRRVTSATSLSLSGTRAEGEGIHVIAVAASDLLNNHLAFCAFGAPGSAERAGQDKSSQKWHIVPWKRGRFHSITALSFSSDASHLLVGTARGAYALDTKVGLEHLLESEADTPKRDQRGDREGVGTNATPSRGGQRGRRKSAANATWSWDKSNQNSPASVRHGAGQQTSPESSPKSGGDRKGRTSVGREISVLLENSHSKVVSCLCWKRSGDGADVACVVTRSGLITMFDLDSKSQLCQTEIDLKFELGSQREVVIRKVFHVKACASQSLLLCSSPQGGGPFYSLLLECKDPNGSLNGYEALPEAAILKAFQVKEMEEGRFGTTARNGSPRSGAHLAVHQGSHATLVSCHDTVASTMEIYDADRPEDPVFVHRVPPLTLHLVVTQALIFAIHGPHRPLDESQRGGEGAVNVTSGSSVAGLFNSSSWYGIAGLEEASDVPSHYFVSIISRFIGDPERGRGVQAMNLVLEQLVVPSPFGKATTPLGAQRMGDGLVLWTDASAFVCAAARDAEELFFSLLQGEARSFSPEPTRKADLLALALRLDILRLYKQAAAKALRKKKFEEAKAYFDLAGLSDLDVACELLAAQCPQRALAIIGGGSKGEGEAPSPGREAVAEGKSRVLRHAAIAMKLMQTLAGADANVASDAAAAAAAAIADWALVCCRRGDKGKRKRGEKSFRLMVSAAILASILHAPNGLPSERESAGNKSICSADSESIDGLARIHESDFREMFFSMMKTGAVSNLPFATEEDLVALLTREVTGTEAAAKAEASSGGFTLGFHERTVSALFAMQARLRGGDETKERAERQRLQADLERICSTTCGAASATHLDTPWALPACVAWNNSKAAAKVLETIGIRESALMCRILELSSSASAADWSGASDDGDDDDDEKERRGLVLDLVRLCEKVEQGPKRVKCLYFLLLFWIKTGLPTGALERGILANGLRKGFCGSLLEAEKLCAAQVKGGVVFSGSFLWQVAQKTCTDEMERKAAAKTWAKIKRAMFPGNQGKGGKRHSSRKIVVGTANLKRAGRGHLVVFSCGHHFTDREFRDKILPGLHAALEGLPRPLGLTKTLLMAAYQGDTFPLSCPVCTYNAIAAKFAKPAISPKYWLG